MFMYLSFLMNILFLNSNNPLILGMVLLLQTIFISMLMGKISFSFWFSYIIFLVFVGGLLILFIYMISLIYNNKFNFFYNNNKNLILIMFILIFFFKLKFMNNYESNLMNKMFFFNEENSVNLMKLYNFPNNFINMMMISYLFFMMVIVVKITNFFMGPIRSFNNNNN